MGVLVTYDLSGKQAEVKAEMLEQGYLDFWEQNERIYSLPNTTLWHRTVSREEALSDITEAARAQSVNLQRAVVVESHPWSAIQGEPHSTYPCYGA